MKRISGWTTNFRKKGVLIILAINCIIAIVWLCMPTIVFKDFFAFIAVTIILTYSWIINFRKLQVVYLGGDYIVKNKKKIYFKNIIEISRTDYICYRVEYAENKDIHSFIFLPNTLPFVEPYYIRKIKNYNSKK